MWLLYALLSALFAALVALFAKLGMKGIDSDLATAIRTIVILIIAWGIALSRGAATGIQALSPRNWIFLLLSGTATGLSWIFLFPRASDRKSSAGCHNRQAKRCHRDCARCCFPR